MVKTTDSVAITVERTAEALCVADRCPCTSMLNIRTQDDVQIFATLDALVQRLMTCELARGNQSCFWIGWIIEYTQVEEVLQQVEAIRAARLVCTIVVDVNLRLAIHVCMVNVVVVFLCLHHLLQVVVVRHRELYRVRIGLTQIRLCVVCHPVTILIPVHRCAVIDVRLSVFVHLGIIFVGEDFPSGAGNLKCTRLHRRQFQSDHCTWQHDGRIGKRSDLWCTTLEVDVDVHDMTFADRRDVITTFIALLILIHIDDRDNLLLREIIDVTLTIHVKRGGLDRCRTVDSEARLQILQFLVVISVNKGALLNSLSNFVSISGTCTTHITQHFESYTFTLLADDVLLTAIVIILFLIYRITLVICTCLIYILLTKLYLSDIGFLLVFCQRVKDLLFDGLTRSIWDVTLDEWLLHHVIGTWSLNEDG